MDIISRYERPVVVVSATARTTRQLISAAELAVLDLEQAAGVTKGIGDRHKELVTNFLKNYPDRDSRQVKEKCFNWIEERLDELDEFLRSISAKGELTAALSDSVASIGEQLSSYLFSHCGRVYGLETEWTDARSVIKTDSDFGKANPDLQKISESAGQLSSAVEKGAIPVIGGYYGENEKKQITTLGFEGSDFSASLVGSVLDAEAIEIWTDVSGIYTCDPRVVGTAYPITELSFREATELAYFGAKVLHPSTMKPASAKNIPIYVKNIFEANHAGTKIHGQAESNGKAKAMTFLNNITILTVTSENTLMGYDFLSEVFRVLAERHLPVDVVTTTEASVSVALEDGNRLDRISEELKNLGEVSRLEGQGLISMIGCAAEKTADLRQDILNAIADAHVSMLSFNKATKNLNIVLPEAELTASVRAIHDNLFC